MKKIIFLALMVIFTSLSINIFSPQNALANGKNCSNSQFFGLPAWYRGLVDSSCSVKKINQEGKDGGVTVQQFVWTVVGNIFDGIFRIIGVVAVGFIVWAGIQYMISTGDSGKMGKAKTTLTNAIIGLIISLVASSIVQLVMGVF